MGDGSVKSKLKLLNPDQIYYIQESRYFWVTCLMWFLAGIFFLLLHQIAAAQGELNINQSRKNNNSMPMMRLNSGELQGKGLSILSSSKNSKIYVSNLPTFTHYQEKIGETITVIEYPARKRVDAKIIRSRDGLGGVSIVVKNVLYKANFNDGMDQRDGNGRKCCYEHYGVTVKIESTYPNGYEGIDYEPRCNENKSLVGRAQGGSWHKAYLLHDTSDKDASCIRKTDPSRNYFSKYVGLTTDSVYVISPEIAFIVIGEWLIPIATSSGYPIGSNPKLQVIDGAKLVDLAVKLPMELDRNNNEASIARRNCVPHNIECFENIEKKFDEARFIDDNQIQLFRNK